MECVLNKSHICINGTILVYADSKNKEFASIVYKTKKGEIVGYELNNYTDFGLELKHETLFSIEGTLDSDGKINITSCDSLE